MNSVSQNRLVRIDLGKDGRSTKITDLTLSQKVDRPDGMRSIKGGRLLLAENAGKMDVITLNGQMATVTTIKEGLDGTPAVTETRGLAWIIEGKLNLKGKGDGTPYQSRRDSAAEVSPVIVSEDGQRSRGSPSSLRLHNHFSLHLSPAHYGSGAVAGGAEDHRAADRQRALQSVRPVLGKNLRHQFRHGCGHGHPHGVSVRNQLGPFFEGRGRGDRPDAGDGGMFSFFLESSFLGLFLFGEKRLGPKLHWLTGVLVFIGSWLSGYFIIATDSWMQHPVGHTVDASGNIVLTSIGALLTNPWILWQYTHNMTASVVTASFVMAALGAFYLLSQRSIEFGRTFVRLGVISGTIGVLLLAFPTGDQQAKMVALHQPVTLAAMEGLFRAEQGAPLVLIGQPDVENMRLDNPIAVPRLLSFLTYQRWHAEVKGLVDFPRDQWPDNIPLLYFSYHMMVGLGTIMTAVMGISLLLLWLRRIERSRWMLWILMLSFPAPYIATTAGWMTAEIGRQPWVIYGLMRTADGTSARVSAGNGLFTLMGFMGLYTLLGILFLFMVWREVEHGPEASEGGH